MKGEVDERWKAAVAPRIWSSLAEELGEELSKVKIEEEHLLSKKPMQIDYLIVKLEKGQKIRKNIGQLFQLYNIVEYKSPEDYLSINDFYKAYGYACFFQSDTEKVMEIHPQDIGITFVCNHYPRKMLRHLRETRGITVKKRENGIYELAGDPIPMQLIITHKLTKEKNLWMQSLRNNLKSGGEIQKLIEAYEEKKTMPSYQAVMEVIIQANRTEMEVEKEMCNALRELFADEFKEAERNGEKTGERTGIRILIESGCAWKKSMKEITDILIMKFGLSQSEAEKYMKLYYK